MICRHCERDVRPNHFYRSGKARCQNRLFWNSARRWRLLGMIEEGWTDSRIGAQFGCSADAVRLARRHHELPSRTGATLTCRKAAAMLGFGCGKKVTWLIESGWLTGVQAQRRGRNHQWLIRHNDLIAFLEDERYWQLWEPARITEAGLRAWAIKTRGDVRFLSMGEAARRLCIETRTLWQWIAKGWIPAVRTGVDAGNHLIRESDVAQCDRRPWGPVGAVS